MSRKLSLEEVIQAGKRVIQSAYFKRIVKNNRRNVVMEIDGETHFVSAGFVCAELDCPGYSQRNARHRPRKEGKDLTHEHHLLEAELAEVTLGHPDFFNLLEQYLDETSVKFGLGEEWRTVRVQNGRSKDFAFFVVPSATRTKILAIMENFPEQMPASFGDAKKWFVAHPSSDGAFPAKIVWGLATGKLGRDFTAHQARDGLRKLGFEVADLSASTPEEFREPLFEGKTRTVTKNIRERNPVARKLCIDYYLARDGRLVCMVCEFDFTTRYGSLGNGFIHVHHLDPLSEANDVREIAPEIDLVPVCPNCHAMIHRGGHSRSICEMRKLIKKSIPE